MSFYVHLVPLSSLFVIYSYFTRYFQPSSASLPTPTLLKPAGLPQSVRSLISRPIKITQNTALLRYTPYNETTVLQLIKYIYFIAMSVIRQYYQTQALVFSIVGLSIAPLLPLFFRRYFRGLEFLQMCYLFAAVMNTSAFSGRLGTAMINFNKNLLTFCTSGDFVCSNGFALSFAAVLVGVLLLAFIFVLFRRCCGRKVDYEPVFLTLKGFIKWFYVALAFAASVQVLNLVFLTIDMKTLLPPAVTLGVLALFPFLQLLANKCIQKQNGNIWAKYLEFLDYLRLLSTSVLVACYVYYKNDTYLQLIMIALIICPLLHLWKGDYKYPILERVIYILGEAAFLALYYLFKYKPSYVTDYDLDVYALGGVILIDAVLYFIRTLKMICYGVHEGSSVVNPEDTQEVELKESSSPKALEKKKSKYEHDSGEELQQSRQDLELIKKSQVKNQVKKRR